MNDEHVYLSLRSLLKSARWVEGCEAGAVGTERSEPCNTPTLRIAQGCAQISPCMVFKTLP